MQKALKGEFDFDVQEVLKEGWELTKKDKSSMVQGLLFIVLIAFIVMITAHTVSQQKGIDFNDPNFRMGTEIIIMILVAPFAAGLMMMGINSSIGGKNTISHLFQFINRTFTITVTSLMISALVQIGMLLLILPGLYLVVATGFSIPLILDKGLLPMRAIWISIKIVNFQWLKFVKLYMVFLGLMFLVFITFGIALIWVAPFYYNVKGLLYRDIFGVGNEHQVHYPETNNNSDNNGDDIDELDSRINGNGSSDSDVKDNVNKPKKPEDYFDA